MRKSDLQSVGQLRDEDTRIRREVEEELREEMRALKDRAKLVGGERKKLRKPQSMRPPPSPHHWEGGVRIRSGRVGCNPVAIDNTYSTVPYTVIDNYKPIVSLLHSS